MEAITLKSRAREVWPLSTWMQAVLEVLGYVVTYRNQILKYKNIEWEKQKKVFTGDIIIYTRNPKWIRDINLAICLKIRSIYFIYIPLVTIEKM